MGFGNRGVVPDKWSSRILWACAIGSAVVRTLVFKGTTTLPYALEAPACDGIWEVGALYMVAVDRQTKNREKMLAEGLAEASSAPGGEQV